MTGGEPVLARNGRSVSQIEASAQNRKIVGESVDLEINLVFRK